MKYGKKVRIDAIKLNCVEIGEEKRENLFDETPNWLADAWDKGIVKPVIKSEDYYYVEIEASAFEDGEFEGEYKFTASPGDYLYKYEEIDTIFVMSGEVFNFHWEKADG